MRKLLLTLAFCLISTFASAQCGGIFPAGSVCGAITQGPPKPIPFTSFAGGYNIDIYGCKGDGITDDAVCFAAAWAAVPANNTLFFTTGKTYYVNSNPNATFCVTPNRTIPIRVDLNGATILIGSGVSNCVFEIDQTTSYLTAAIYGINTATAGDTAVTLTSSPNAVHFAAGNIFYIQGEVATLNNRAMNIIQSVNNSTGVISLKFPLGKTYSTTPKVADVESLTTRGFSLRNGNVRWVVGSTSYLALVEQVYQPEYINLNIDGTNTTAGLLINQNSGLDTHYEENTFISPNGAIEFGGRGSTIASVIGNTVYILGPGNNALGSCEGCELSTLTNNTINVLGSDPARGPVIDMTGSVNYTLNNNLIIFGGSAMQAGSSIITTNNGAGNAAVNAIIANNVISGPTVPGIYSKGKNDSIIGNTILSKLQAVYLAGTGPSNVIGNIITCYSTTGQAAIEVTANLAPEQSLISGNTVIQPAGKSCTGVAIDDPGSVVTTAKLNVIGNNFQNLTAGVTFSGSAATNLPNVNVAFNAFPTSDRIPSFTVGTGSALTSTGPGGALSSAAFKATGTSGSTIPLLNSANTWSALQTFANALSAIWIQTSFIYTGANLPSCGVSSDGVRASVSDANGPTYGASYVSGGAVHAPVYCNGTVWKTF